MRYLLVAMILAGLGHCAWAFDFTAYPLRDLDRVIAEGRGMDPVLKSGVMIMAPPPKLSFDARLEGFPERCRTDFLLKTLRMQGVGSGPLTGINSCFRVRSPKGEVLSVFVQDVVSGYIGKELELGDPVRLFVIYSYFRLDAQLPYFLVNEFQVAMVWTMKSGNVLVGVAATLAFAGAVVMGYGMASGYGGGAGMMDWGGGCDASEGKDAQGVVHVRLQVDGHIPSTHRPRACAPPDRKRV